MVRNLSVRTRPFIERVSRGPNQIFPVVPPSLVVGLLVNHIPNKTENPCLNVALRNKPGELLGFHADQFASVIPELLVELR